jgi:hypothetical protein
MPKTKTAKTVKAKARPAKRSAKRKTIRRQSAARASTKRRVKKAALKSRKSAKRKAATNFNVFIAWSGKDSRTLGSSLNRRLKTIIPKIKVLFSPAFNPGAAWARSVQTSIRSAKYAIICVTKDSLDSRWINFEAGAAWKALKQSNVCPLLLDIEPNDLKGPLELFQAKQFTRGDFEDICKYLAKKTKTSLNVVTDNLDAVWPTLEKEIRSGLEGPRGAKKPSGPDFPVGGPGI